MNLYENEQSNSFNEISLGHGNSISKLFVIGTSIFENQSKEAIKGHLYLVEINQNNNYSIKKLNEIETKGGVYKVKSCKNIIYACIGNILYIYKLSQLYDNSYEFQLIKKSSDFTLINDIFIWEEDEEQKEKENNNIIKKDTDIHYLVISDLFRSVGIYLYDVIENKLSEICRDYNNTWVYSSLQLRNDLLFIILIIKEILFR